MKAPDAISRDLLDGLGSTPWRLIESSGKTLTLRVYFGGCYSYKDVVASESAQRIVIAARSKVSHDEVCALGLKFRQITLNLKSPANGRTLVHIPLDKTWAHVKF